MNKKSPEEKIDMLINHYLKAQDFSQIEDMPEWALRYLISNHIKTFIYPLLEDKVMTIR